MAEKFTYKDAGVDVELADKVIGSLTETIRATFRREVAGKMGGFAALVHPDWTRYKDPLMVSAADGVGTKLKIAFLTGIHDTVGMDLVAMNVNDILATGAEPLFFLDYLATGAIEPETVRAVISGIARGCKQANCSLVGGETAEMPDFYPAGEYDLAGFCVGMVDKENVLDGSRIRAGDALLGLASSGVHSNGFSLVRKVLLEHKGYSLENDPAGIGRSLGEELLTPTAIYVRPVLDLMRNLPVSGIAHITGGGFHGNVPRILPDTCRAVVRSGSWEVPEIFRFLKKEADLDDEEMHRIFNMGVGLILAVPNHRADEARRILKESGTRTWIIGEVTSRSEGENAFRIA